MHTLHNPVDILMSNNQVQQILYHVPSKLITLYSVVTPYGWLFSKV